MIDHFGSLSNGNEVKRVTIEHQGLRASIITYGASLVSLRLDDHPRSVVLGFDNLENHIREAGYFGSIVGRVANRIANGKAVIEGKTQILDKNENERQMLHGGSDGTSTRNWRIRDHGQNYVVLEDHLPHLHMGFQGAMDVRVSYQILSNQNLKIDISAKSDQDTFCNFAHHSYFNLDGTDDILDHLLQIEADTYLPVDTNLIPRGICEDVENTPFDFRELRPIAWLGRPYNYDHNFCLSKTRSAIRPVARLISPATGLEMTVSTTEPGLQVFDGKSTTSQCTGNGGKHYEKYAGIALEPQFWPDAPNHSNFPDILLKAGQQYRQTSVFMFA